MQTNPVINTEIDLHLVFFALKRHNMTLPADYAFTALVSIKRWKIESFLDVNSVNWC